MTNETGKTSARRQAASRANGALSKGPVSAEGKSRSSRNALIHGCLASLLTFTSEDAVIFDEIHTQYLIRFEPRDQAEHDLVDEVTRAKWQMRQAWIFESCIIGLQMAQDAETVDRNWKSLGDQDRRALAFTASLKDNNTLANLQRYSRSLALQAERAIKLLMEMKKQPLPPAIQPGHDPVSSPERNEPSPISGHQGLTRKSPFTPAPASARAVHAYVATPSVPRIPAEWTPNAVPSPNSFTTMAAGE